MTVSEKGSVESFYVMSPAGLHLEKDKEIRKAVKAIQFKPAEKDGHPVAAQISMTLDCSSNGATTGEIHR